jgi:hypothetical protein
MSEEQPSASKSKWGMNIFLAFLTWFLISGFMSVLSALFFWHVPDGNKEILVYMAGQLSGFTGSAVALWTNTTYQSAQKTEMLAKSGPIDPH